MANIRSAKKRIGQSEKHRQRNASLNSAFRTRIRRIEKLVAAKDKAAASDLFKQSVPMFDGLVNKGIAHRNKIARCKSRLNARIQAIAG